MNPGLAETADPILSVRALRTQFTTRDGVITAVRDVSFELRAKQRLGIVGESGSGKSALALSILGLIEPPGRVVSGEVRFRGHDLRALSERELLRVRGNDISLIFQDPMTALDPIRRVGDQLVEAIRAHQNVSRSHAWRRGVELLREVEIPFADRRVNDYPHQYSGGMRQRVMIAIALANDPDVLIADEPTTALDVTTQAQILDLLERLAVERGAAVILITHNLGIVADFCDSVQVMYAGRIVESAPLRHLFSHPVHPYTEALLKSVPRMGRDKVGPLYSISGRPPSLATLPRGCAFEPRCSLGGGRKVCIEDAPPIMEWHTPTGSVMAECHFGADRFANHESLLERADG